ncbi:hypothetical protein B0H14DRAFT_1042653 [Mycena olivaceomarginata]|nr:hypothetical protein B0H14DRAFT_1042653 [Mycena olivaceomarginata]
MWKDTGWISLFFFRLPLPPVSVLAAFYPYSSRCQLHLLYTCVPHLSFRFILHTTIPYTDPPRRTPLIVRRGPCSEPRTKSSRVHISFPTLLSLTFSIYYIPLRHSAL